MQPKQQLLRIVEFANDRFYPQVQRWRDRPFTSQNALLLLETYQWLDFGAKIGVFPQDDARHLAIEFYYPVFVDFEKCSSSLPAQVVAYLNNVRRRKHFFDVSRDLDFAVPPETITEMQAMFDVLLQRSTRLVSNSYFLYFQRLASAPSIRTWSAILQQDVIRIAINDATFSKGLNASVKTSEEAVRQVTLFSDEFSDESIETPDGGPGWWNALKGFFVSTEYIAAQKEILLAIRDHNSGEVKSLYGPLSRRLDFMERWLMDFRNSQLFSSRFYELRDIAADAVSDPTVLGKENKFKSAIEELVQFWIHRGNPARLSASGKA